MLTVTQLRVIDAVHRLGSVTAAGGELGYAQPSISHPSAIALNRNPAGLELRWWDDVAWTEHTHDQ